MLAAVDAAHQPVEVGGGARQGFRRLPAYPPVHAMHRSLRNNIPRIMGRGLTLLTPAASGDRKGQQPIAALLGRQRTMAGTAELIGVFTILSSPLLLHETFLEPDHTSTSASSRREMFSTAVSESVMIKLFLTPCPVWMRGDISSEHCWIPQAAAVRGEDVRG